MKLAEHGSGGASVLGVDLRPARRARIGRTRRSGAAGLAGRRRRSARSGERRPAKRGTFCSRRRQADHLGALQGARHPAGARGSGHAGHPARRRPIRAPACEDAPALRRGGALAAGEGGSARGWAGVPRRAWTNLALVLGTAWLPVALPTPTASHRILRRRSPRRRAPPLRVGRSLARPRGDIVHLRRLRRGRSPSVAELPWWQVTRTDDGRRLAVGGGGGLPAHRSRRGPGLRRRRRWSS